MLRDDLQERLNQRLYDLFQAIRGDSPYESASSNGRSIVEPVAGKTYGETLVSERWEQQWIDDKVVYSGQFGDIQDDDSCRELWKVFVELIPYVLARTAAEQAARKMKLQTALAHFLELRGFHVTAEPDGPRPPDTFVWQGNRATLSKTLWRLVDAIWKRKDRKADKYSLCAEVWKDEEKAGGALASALSRANDSFLRATPHPIPLHLRQVGDFVVMED